MIASAHAYTPPFAAWLAVPERVTKLLPAALKLRAAHDKAAAATGLLPLAAVSWDPDTARVFVHTEKPQSDYTKTAYAKKLGGDVVFVTEPVAPEHVTVKLAEPLFPRLGAAWQNANKFVGGPTPLSHAIVSGLALGGLGYGAGTLIENLFPERYLERGTLRKPLAALGGLGGLGFGAMNAHALSKIPELDKTFWQAWLTNTDKTPYTAPEQKKAAISGTNLAAPIIKVDAFNRAVWADASRGFDQTGIIGGDGFTAPSVAAATTGLVSGVAARERSSIISPAQVIKGLASAGVGLGVASVAGKTLGALAGLTPHAQEKLQDLGLWGGMLNTVIPPIFGAR